jgi:hypothetical protein
MSVPPGNAIGASGTPKKSPAKKIVSQKEIFVDNPDLFEISNNLSPSFKLNPGSSVFSPITMCSSAFQPPLFEYFLFWKLNF